VILGGRHGLLTSSRAFSPDNGYAGARARARESLRGARDRRGMRDSVSGDFVTGLHCSCGPIYDRDSRAGLSEDEKCDRRATIVRFDKVAGNVNARKMGRDGRLARSLAEKSVDRPIREGYPDRKNAAIISLHG